MSSGYVPLNFNFDMNTGGNSNQYFSPLPTLPSFNATSGMSNFGTSGSGSGSGSNNNVFMPTINNTPGFDMNNPTGPGMTGIGKGEFAVNPLDPTLTSNFFNYLNSQIGQGVTPYGGQLSAPINDLLQQLSGAFSPGGSLGTLATQGFDSTSLFNTMKQAMQRNIGEGAANLKEQMNVGGNLVGSPYGTAATDYQTQTVNDLNSLLGQLTLQGTGLQLQAADQQEGLGNLLQTTAQSADDRAYQEFIRTSPQYNPLLSMMYGGATTFPPTLKPGQGMGGLGALLSGAGSLAGGGADLGALIQSLFAGGGGAAADLGALAPSVIGFCWIAEVLYGKNDRRTHLVRRWLKEVYDKTFVGHLVVNLYRKYGERIAAKAKGSKKLRAILKPIFNLALAKAEAAYAGN